MFSIIRKRRTWASVCRDDAQSKPDPCTYPTIKLLLSSISREYCHTALIKPDISLIIWLAVVVITMFFMSMFNFENISQRISNESSLLLKHIYMFIFLQFRFASTVDKLLMMFGALNSALIGAAMPLMVVVFGSMTDMFIYDEQFVQFAQELFTELEPYLNQTNLTGESVIEFIEENPMSFK